MADTSDPNQVQGSVLPELILGTNEDETIDGAGGSDVVDGGGGNDSITGGDASAWDLFFGNSDTLMGGSGDDTVEGGAGNDLIFGGSGNDSLDGGEGNDLVRGGTGNDTIEGGAGNDFLLGDGGDDSIDGGTGDDWVFGGSGNDTLAGGSGNDLLFGGAGDDSLDGGSGDDTLVGGEGNDTLTGGAGADTFVIPASDGGTLITDFDAGNDVLDLGELDANITLELLLGKMTEQDTNGDGTNDVVIDLTDFGGGTVTLQGVGLDDLKDGTSLDPAHFDFDDVRFGDEDEDNLDGGIGDDTLIGGEGNDTLTGGAGADTFVFGADHGNDLITDFDTSNDSIDLSGLTGRLTLELLLGKMTEEDTNSDGTNDVVIDLTDFGGGTVTLQGVGLDDLKDGASLNPDLFDLGTLGDDTVEGTTANERITGGFGNDSMTGGGGYDIFAFADGHGNDTITDFDARNDWIDLRNITTEITAAQLLAAMTDLADSDGDGRADGVTIDLTAFGGGIITLEGVTKADLMHSGGLRPSVFLLPDGVEAGGGIVGYEGGSELSVGDGPDIIWGAEGNDTITGGAGNDDLFGGEGDDSITGGAGEDWIFGGEGNDSIDAGADNDLVWGGEGNDTIDGGAGNDFLRGDGGDDSIDGGAGEDRILGGEGNDTIDGGAGADWIAGGEGNDRLTGGTEADTFAFGADHGNDTITDFADGEDLIDLSALDGVTQFSDLTITADGNDAVIDTGEGTIRLVGVSTSDLDASDFKFSTIGDSGANTIEGGDGRDTIDGKGGDDSLTGGADADTFVFQASHGNDTITDFTDGEDLIDVSALGITDIDGLTITTNADNDLVINTGDGNGTIVLEGVSDANLLTAEDFIFAPPTQDMGDGM